MTDKAARDIEVELDIFSGRPNPTWRLEPQTASRVLALLEEGGTPVAEPAKPPGLGFRGFVLRISRGEPQLSPVVRVYRGIVSAASASGSKHATLPALEKLLLHEACQQGHARVLRAFGVDIPDYPAS